MLVEWMTDYLATVEKYPVKSQVQPREIFNQIPDKPPSEGENFDQIFNDFEEIIIPGITHWQSPRFHAYFPANSSPPSVLAEMLTATLAAQCMIWDTSPAAAELEEKMMNWLRDMIGLPKTFSGVVQDTASTATLCSLLTAREKATNYEVNASGLHDKGAFTVYCSSETHSSIEKAVKICGFGKENLRKISVDENYALRPSELEETVKIDLGSGFTPLAVVATIGTTGSTAIDPIKPIGEICSKYKLWLHVDAALAGTALLLPEQRWMIEGIDYVDTFTFNPHKWMFTNFDLNAYFIKDPQALVQTFEITPEYLKTQARNVNNYRDWGVPLGRRFRALKLWFVIRHFGFTGLQEKIRFHIQLTEDLKQKIEQAADFEVLAPVSLNTICFRYNPKSVTDLEKLNQINEELLVDLNRTGKLYLTHTKLNGIYCLRFVVGQTDTQERHVNQAWNLIHELAEKINC
jgi:aromatic-L-amino-acid decarboxylase